MGQNNRGFVLVCVLWVTALLAMITLGLGRRASLDRRAAAYALDHVEAMMMARGAVDRGIVELYNRGLTTLLLPAERREGTHLGQSWARTDNLFKHGYFEQAEQYENDSVSYVIIDEERFININTADRELLENIPSLPRPVVRRIWARRTDEVHEEEGVAPFHAVEEIRYLRGIDDEDWFGAEGNPGLKDLLTVWGDGRINVNTASREVLECLPGVREGDIAQILRYRAGADGVLNTADDVGFSSMDDLTEKTGVTGATREALDKYCKSHSSFFRIIGVATRRQGRVRALCSAVVSMEDGPAVLYDWQERTIGS